MCACVGRQVSTQQCRRERGGVHGGQEPGFRNRIGETARESTGSRRDWKEEAHRRLLVGLDAHGGDGNDEAAKKFSTGRGRGGSEATAWGTPGLGVDVVEEEDLEAEACACSARTEALHRSLSTTTPLCFHPRHQKFREEKGEIGEEKTAAAAERERV